VTDFVTRLRPVNGYPTPLPPSQSMPSSVTSMVLAAFPVVTKSPPQICGDVSCPVPPICPGGSAVGVNIIVDVIVTGIYVF